ncbi:alpha/beta hydrolase [Pseudothauera rhizosphaerae]|uniref:Alpha/beta hydrolase n=1 Tax=Pseudothauera rhizosphaerae TaxID=2565932 RepID=A0A4V3W9K3_9RHOO|nr:alpha/beta hydrolase-fold protein [Pseudothauera rhizosphaerae]THF55624.1 alpha/beta hydrolase [Pseudothauera rhizosphaerae]
MTVRSMLWRALLATLLVAALPVRAQTATELAPPPAEWGPVQLSRSLGFDIDSRHTGQRYRIALGLPHKPAPAGGYPVLWALDGMASFPLMEVMRPRPPADGESTAWRRKVGDEPAGLIVAVGYASGEPIDVHGRALDYTPPGTSGPTGDKFSTRHGGADAFLRFLTEELRPLLARHFPMDPQRHTLFGFSYGGLFALHVLSTRPQHFQRYWAASPSLWFAGHHLLDALPQRLPALDFAAHPVLVEITAGVDEQYPQNAVSPERLAHLQARRVVDNAERFARLLDGAGAQVRFHKLADHDHHDMLTHGARRVIEFAFAP